MDRRSACLDTDDVAAYYAEPEVRARILEFLGASTGGEASCVSIARCDAITPSGYEMRRPSALDEYLAQGVDISRSLWDREGLIAHLDLEYVNFDYLAEPYLHPLRSFTVQEPVVETLKSLLAAFGITPLHVLSGRGHHFTWRIPRASPAFEQLAACGYLSRELEGFYSQVRSPTGEPLDRDLGAAFAGLGQVMEWLAHQTRKQAWDRCRLPIELCAVEVEPQERGREILSLDITEYGDPLNTRNIRIPFTVYLKPWLKGGGFSDPISDQIPLMFAIPMQGLGIEQGILIMRDCSEAAALAEHSSTVIPDYPRGTEALITAYRQSPLARFHQRFYRYEHDPPESWPNTYDCTPLDELPPEVAHLIVYPNDGLLKPIGIWRLVQALLERGWEPRHVAGLIRSKYERDYGWGAEWYTYDASTRADFYTRLFAGAMALETGGLDEDGGLEQARSGDDVPPSGDLDCTLLTGKAI